MAKKIFVESDTQVPPEAAKKALPMPAAWAATMGWDADTYWQARQDNGPQLEACEYDDDDPIGDQAPPGYDETDFREDK